VRFGVGVKREGCYRGWKKEDEGEGESEERE
jgi:hypothetical protein